MRTRGLEFHFLGGFTVQWNGEQLPPIPSRTGRSLLAFLVTHHGQTHRRDALAARFWPDLPTARARRRLSHALWQIQDTFGDIGERFLHASPDTLRIAPEAEFWLDTHEFEEIAESVRKATIDPADALHRIRPALDLYRGDFLAGTYDDWVLNEQERLDQLHLALLARGIEAAKAQGEYEQALTYARRVTHHEPLREEAHREAMRLCVLLGRTSEALGLYERCRSVLEEELGAEPAEETTLLYERIASHRQASSDSLPGTDARLPTGSLSSSLVGREHERMAIVESLEQALAGHGGVVFVEGEAGLGKSRLATAIVEDAEWRGFSVLWGACDELGAGRPYAPIITALESALTPVRVQQLRPRIDPIWLSEVAAVVPALRRATASDLRQRLSGLEGAQRMREAITRVVLGHSDVRPSLLVIEDLHWADEETLGLLHVIGPRLAAHRIVLLLTFRSDEARASDGTWELLRHLDQLTAPQRIELDPLGEAHVNELLRGVFGADLAEKIGPRIVDEVGGNPLFVIETLRALRDTGHLRSAADDIVLDDLPLARTVQETIDARLGTLTGEERHVLEVVSVHGRAPSLDAILAAADLPTLAAADAIEGLVNRGFLAEEVDAYGLHHDLVRRIVYDGLPEPSRRAHHERVGAALEETRPDDVEALARHHLAADAPAKALRYLILAANKATEIHAYETAARHRATAIGLLDRVPTSVDARYALLAAHEAVLDVLGRRDEQTEALEQMADLAVDSATEVETQRRHAWLFLQTDRFDEGIDQARSAVATARDTVDLDVEARLLTTIGTGLEWAGRWHEAVEAHEDAVSRAEGDRARMEAELALGNALRGVQRYEEAQDALERALELATAADDRRQLVRILGALANVHSEVGATAEAEAHQRRALEMARTIGFRHGEGILLINLANTLYHRGRIAEAMRDYDDAVRVFREIGNRRGEALASVNASSTRIEVLGDLATARDDLERCLVFFDEVGDAATAAQCEQLLGRADHMTGATDEARRRHESAIGRLESAPHSWLEVQFRRDLAEAELEAGEFDRALELLDNASETCESLGLSDLAVGISALRGRVLVERGDVDAAITETERAVAQITGGVERPHLVYWAHHLALTAVGRDDEAENALREAHDMLDNLLDGLSSDEKRRALTTVPTSAAIETAARDRRAEIVEVRLASADAPTGRPLVDDDRVRIAWTVHTPDDEDAESPVERRRRRLVRLLDEASAQGAAPTVEDLSEVLDVSSATVRRDLAALRSQGHDLRTRGSRAS